MAFNDQINELNKRLARWKPREERLKNLDLFVLDNSLRETTVGQLRGHTIENKWKIYNEVKKCGFQHIIVASFNHMTRLGDSFIMELKEAGEDFEYLYAFTELVETYKDKIPQDDIPIGCIKSKEYGIKNIVIEMDLMYHGINYEKFGADKICQLLSKRFDWIRKNLSEDSRIFVNLRDFADCFKKNPERIFKVINHISSLPKKIFGIAFEEQGKYSPEQVGAWTEATRKEMDRCGFKEGHLICHLHQQWGICDISQIEALANGGDGIWAGVCEEGAAMGHASSCLTLMNLVRLGNKKVLKRYNCQQLRNAAIAVTHITTGKPPHPKQAVYGERALDIVFGLDQFLPSEDSPQTEFSLASFLGEEPVMRISTLASPGMIQAKLVKTFGEDEQFTEEIGKAMIEKMLEDLHENIKEEYHSVFGLAMLFDRAGGKLTEEMSEVIIKGKSAHAHIEELIKEVRDMWNVWDLSDGTRDDFLAFDSFYAGFMAPYFGCYRCNETTKALKAIDMDADGRVDWNEFAVYLKWAGHQYPESIATAEDLLKIAFHKGLVPAMQDEVLKSCARN